jgi:hypothetical protein
MHKELIRIARAEVGVREVGGPNRGPRVEVYQRATWLDGTGWPWCAAFVCWDMREWLRTPEGIAYLGPKKPEEWRLRDPSAFGALGWARARKLSIGRSPSAGAIVVFDFNGPKSGGGHIGLVSEVLTDGRFRTIEGNTGADGGRDGDGVWEKVRTVDTVVGFIHLRAKAP